MTDVDGAKQYALIVVAAEHQTTGRAATGLGGAQRRAELPGTHPMTAKSTLMIISHQLATATPSMKQFTCRWKFRPRWERS